MTVLVVLRWHLLRQNQKKDELAAAGIHEANDENMIHAFHDLTDWENMKFGHVY